jgi:hypothetical protein
MARSTRFMFLALIAALLVGAVALHRENARLAAAAGGAP